MGGITLVIPTSWSSVPHSLTSLTSPHSHTIISPISPIFPPHFRMINHALTMVISISEWTDALLPDFLLKETCMIRRMKDDVLNEMPKKIRHFVKVTLLEEDQKAVDEVKQKMDKKKSKMQEGDTNPLITEYILFPGAKPPTTSPPHAHPSPSPLLSIVKWRRAHHYAIISLVILFKHLTLLSFPLTSDSSLGIIWRQARLKCLSRAHSSLVSSRNTRLKKSY